MPLCGGCLTSNPTSDPFVDADRIIKDYAWKSLELRWWQRLCRWQYEPEVNWGYLERKHHIQSFTLRDCAQPVGSKAQQKANEEFAREMCLFRTEFTNETGTKQNYTFNTERTTVSSCDISTTKSYTIGGKLDAKFSIPLPCDVTGGLSGQFQLTKKEGTTYTETLTWSVDTQIEVAEQTKTTASLNVVEKTLEADYVIKTSIKPIRSGVTVYFRHKRSREVITKVEILQDDFASLFEGKGGFEVDKADTSTATCLTKGSLRAVYGAEQKIKITHEPLVKSQETQAPPAEDVVGKPSLQVEDETKMLLVFDESMGAAGSAEDDPLVSKTS